MFEFRCNVFSTTSFRISKVFRVWFAETVILLEILKSDNTKYCVAIIVLKSCQLISVSNIHELKHFFLKNFNLIIWLEFVEVAFLS